MSVTESSSRRSVGPNNTWMNGSHTEVNTTWESSMCAGSPKNGEQPAQTPLRNGSVSTSSVTAVATQQTRSPMVTVHQPYRGIPLSVFGVESELEKYAGANMENAVPVKFVYKSAAARMPGSMVRGNMASSQRPSQRSPIAVIDGGDGGHGGEFSSGDTGASATPLERTGGCGSTMNGSGRNVSTRALTNNNGNKRAVAIVHLGGDEEGTAGGTFTGTETGYCPIAHRMVEAEEKHLSYGAVELRPSELNRGNTAERQRRLQQRRRQVQYGKETVGYTKYISVVPNRWEREFQNPMHPITPRPEFDCSKRTFDRYLNVWRRQLHLWDEYDPHNVAPQYTKIGIPTLGRLGLERVQNVPDEQQCGLLSFTPTTAQGITGGTACTPVVPRHVRREMSLSMPSALHQRSVPYPMSGFSTLSGPHSSSAGAPNVRSSSVCGGGSCSITNTPHTPYYGSTRSNSSYPLPFLSVLAQPTIYSPHWPDSSRQSSPNPHGTQRSYGYSYNSGGACSSVPAGCGMYMEGGNHYPNSSYSCRNHNSPYGGYRGTPHSSPNVYHYPYYNNGGSMNMAPPSPMCVGHEAWSNSQRQ